MDNITKQYYDSISKKLSQVYLEESDHIEKAALILNDCIDSDHKVYFFGTGHSYMISQEIFGRAGGYAGFIPILLDELSMNHVVKSTYIERIPEYAQVVMNLYPFEKGDVCVVTSNSGRNQLIIELCLRLIDVGVKIIAITSLSESKKLESRHSSGKRLFELADVVIDNKSEYGDVTIIHSNGKGSGPSSTVVDCFIVNEVVSDFIEMQINTHEQAPVFTSSNIDGGDELNKDLFALYANTK